MELVTNFSSWNTIVTESNSLEMYIGTLKKTNLYPYVKLKVMHCNDVINCKVTHGNDALNCILMCKPIKKR